MSGPRSRVSAEEQQFNLAISRRVEELRIALGVTRKALARSIGVYCSGYYAYEIGSSRWPIWRLELAARFFAVKLSDLLPERKSL